MPQVTKRRLPSVTEINQRHSAAFLELRDTAGLPPEVDFGQSFESPPRMGEPSEAASDVRARTRAMAENLEISPAALRSRPPGVANTPSFLPSQPNDLMGSMPVSGLPSELLDTVYEAEDQRGDKHAFNLRDTLQQAGIGDVATPYPTPDAGAIWEGVQSANPQAFQMPIMPAMPSSAGGTPALNQINNLMGMGIGLGQNADGISRLLNGETSNRQGLADASAIVGALANVLPPEAAKVVAQGAALTQSFAAIDPEHLSLGDASGLIDQVGNALGVPGLGQAAKTIQDMMSAPGGIEGVISDPMSVLNGLAGLDMLTSQLPPMAQAALGQAKAIMGALKQLTTPVPGTVPPGIPGIYVENLMIATLGPLTQTVHGIPLLPGPGSIPTVLATGLPVWRVAMDIHFCPIPQGIPPHGPGVVAVGAVKTFAQGGLIARHTDMVIEALGGPTPIMPAPVATGGGADNEPDDYDPDDADQGEEAEDADQDEAPTSKQTNEDDSDEEDNNAAGDNEGGDAEKQNDSANPPDEQPQSSGEEGGIRDAVYHPDEDDPEFIQTGGAQTPEVQTGKPGRDDSYDNIRGVKYLPKEDIDKVKAAAKELNTDPVNLFAVMNTETGGTYDPATEGKGKGGVPTGHTGLIQFSDGTAKALGTSRSELAKMTFPEQMEYVKSYFQQNQIQNKLSPNPTLSEISTAVMTPAYTGKGDDFVIQQKTSDSNRGLDTNHDGKITIKERTQTVIDDMSKPDPQSQVHKPKKSKNTKGVTEI